jgi:hypothetical protein
MLSDGSGGGGAAYSQYLLPLSKMMRQTPPAARSR